MARAKPAQPVTQQDVDEAKTRYTRLLDLYKKLCVELDAIEKNNKKLRVKVQEAMDKKKMEGVLKNILAQKDK